MIYINPKENVKKKLIHDNNKKQHMQIQNVSPFGTYFFFVIVLCVKVEKKVKPTSRRCSHNIKHTLIFFSSLFRTLFLSRYSTA